MSRSQDTAETRERFELTARNHLADAVGLIGKAIDALDQRDLARAAALADDAARFFAAARPMLFGAMTPAEYAACKVRL